MKKIFLGDTALDLSRPMVMGILNVTPDSFYEGSRCWSEAKIVERLHQIMEEGAGIIDVGAYSTRPGAEFVDEKEELGRLSVAVEAIRKYYPQALISIDTFRAKVAEEIVKCQGPVMINDISGGTLDPDMFDFLVRSGMPYVMMHIQGTPRTMQQQPVYRDVVSEVHSFFTQRIAWLNERGFDNIILDPGFGFGKTLAHNYELMDGLSTYTQSGYPILVGISRKSMIYKLIGGRPEDALNGTTALNTIALMKGASFLRVHDVKAACEVVKIYEALTNRDTSSQLSDFA